MAKRQKVNPELYVTDADLKAWNPYGESRDYTPSPRKYHVREIIEPEKKPGRKKGMTYDPTPEQLEKIRINAELAQRAYQSSIREQTERFKITLEKAYQQIGEYAEHLAGSNCQSQLRWKAWELWVKTFVKLTNPQTDEKIRANTMRNAIRDVMNAKHDRWMMPDPSRFRKWIKEV